MKTLREMNKLTIKLHNLVAQNADEALIKETYKAFKIAKKAHNKAMR